MALLLPVILDIKLYFMKERVKVIRNLYCVLCYRYLRFLKDILLLN